MKLLNSVDRKLRERFDPRLWSNRELSKFAHLFSGKVINVSGWNDSDKRTGKFYRDYFVHANEYWISNYEEDFRGFQGDRPNEFGLDLTVPLPKEMHNAFDVVFNHTTLEHVFDFHAALRCLCELSRDVVIVVVPFMQHEHSSESFGDYWRFSPMAIHDLLQKNGLEPIYLSINSGPDVYVFCIASRTPAQWGMVQQKQGNMLDAIVSGARWTTPQRTGVWGHTKGRIIRAYQALVYDIY